MPQYSHMDKVCYFKPSIYQVVFQEIINSQSLEDTQVEYISQKYT